MPKTDFINGNPALGIAGTIVTAEFLEGLNTHRHDGVDEDGHGSLDYAVATGSANAYAISLTPALTAHVPGMPIHFKANFEITGAATLAVNGMTAVSIKRRDGSALAAGDIKNGQIVKVIHDGTNYQLQSQDTGNVGDANLKLVRNAAVNKVDIFARTSGAVPNADNPIDIPIPDGNGNVLRRRAAAYLSGTSQIILADAAGYWGNASLNGSAYRAYLYAIWDGTGIIWAVSSNMSLRKVTTTTTVTDPNYMLLEASSSYTRNASHYCQLIGSFTYEYDTADTPDHTVSTDLNIYSPDPMIEALATLDMFKVSYGTSGYQKLPSGLIVQWGYIQLTGTSLQITFPIAFPTAWRAVVTTAYSNTVFKSTAASITNTGCYLYAESSGLYIMWIAIGY